MMNNKPKLLLHCCCAPCSSAILEHLCDYYNITLYFYNPNISDFNEYYTRAAELAWLVEEMNVDASVVIEKYNPEAFHRIAAGLENEKECGKRCLACYAQRLKATADYALANGFTEFSTTLTISPYKLSNAINEIGIKIGQANNLTYMPFDFGFLYIRSLELCQKYHLYQQDYCGCKYSKH